MSGEVGVTFGVNVGQERVQFLVCVEDPFADQVI
jgi:hypothetical protein